MTCKQCEEKITEKELVAEVGRWTFDVSNPKALTEVIHYNYIQPLQKKLAKKDAVIARMEEALEFYGDQENWEYEFMNVGGWNVKAETPVEGDWGKKAREALKEEGGGTE